MSATLTMRVETPVEITAALEALALISERRIKAGRVRAGLYESGVRYRREPRGEEKWLAADEVLKAGYGDCEDLVAWRVAELRARGERGARPLAYQTRRPGVVHCIVVRANGQREDPSRLLGMGGVG